MIRRLALLMVVLAMLAGACSSAGGGDIGQENDDGSLRIVTTVAPITNLASIVIGDRASVAGVVPEGTNSHTFEPSPSVAQLLSVADLVFLNGLQLEEPTRQLAEDVAPDSTPIVALGDRSIDSEEYLFDFSFPEDEGKPNPHLWTDPSLALNYAAIIRDEMTALDPDGEDEYSANYDRLAADVETLDTAMREAFDSIDPDDRKLVTYHDAYAYFALNYGWTVVGAVQPSGLSEPSARDIADLVRQIEAEEVPAIFGSEVFPSPVLEQIERETGATYIDDLRDDDLPGEPGEPDHSWLELMRFNYSTIVDALGGDPTPLVEVEFSEPAADLAGYPQ